MRDTRDDHILGNKVRVDFFIRKREYLNTFLVQLKMAFILNSNKYPNTITKVIFTITHLQENTFKWFKPYISDFLTKKKNYSTETYKFFMNFNHFKTELYMVYRTIDKACAAT